MARRSNCSKRAASKLSTTSGFRNPDSRFNHEPNYQRSKAKNCATWSARKLLKDAAKQAAQYEFLRDSRLLMNKRHCTDRPDS